MGSQELVYRQMVFRCGELMCQVEHAERQIVVLIANHGNTGLRARARLRIDSPKCKTIIPAATCFELKSGHMRVAVAVCCHRRHVGWEVNECPAPVSAERARSG